MLVSQLCPALYHPTDCSPPGSSVRGILQTRILEWVGIHLSRESSWPMDQSQVSCISDGFSSVWARREALSSYGKMHESGVIETIPLIRSSATWGQCPALSHPEIPWVPCRGWLPWLMLDGLGSGQPFVSILSSPRAHHSGSRNVMVWWLPHPLFTDRQVVV